jgi:hypothetical protein
MTDAAILKVIEAVAKEKSGNGDMFTAHEITKAVRGKGHRLAHRDGRDAVHDLYSRGEFGIAYTRTQVDIGQQAWPWLYHKTADDPSTFVAYDGSNPKGQPSASPSPVATVPGSAANSNPPTIQIPSSMGTAVMPDDDGDDDDGDDDDGDDDDGDSSLTIALQSHLTPKAAGPVVAAGSSPMVQTTGGSDKGRQVDGRRTLSVPTPFIKNMGLVSGDTAYVEVGRNGSKKILVVRTDDPNLNRLAKYTVDCNNQIRITQATLRKAGIAGDKYDVEEDRGRILVELSD